MRRVSALFVVACSSTPAPAPPAVRVPDAASDAAPDAPPDAPAIDPALRDRGAQLFQDKGCIACHSLDGSFRIGPSLRGDWGATITLDDGATVVVDEAYVRESIRDPLAKRRAGFVPVMPVFGDRISTDELDALVAFIRSL